MKIKRVKKLIAGLDDEMEIFVRNSHNACGNIEVLEQLELSTYGFFGKPIPCIILNTQSSKELELDGDDLVIDFIQNDGSKR